MSRSKVVYIGIFLDSDSQESLLEEVDMAHPNHFAHHCTLAFKPGMEMEAVFAARLGEVVDLEIEGYVRNDRLDVCLIRLQEGLDEWCNNDFPHVTISTAEGVKPFESNDEIEKADQEGTVVPSGGWLRGRIGFFMGNGCEVFSLVEYNRLGER